MKDLMGWLLIERLASGGLGAGRIATHRILISLTTRRILISLCCLLLFFEYRWGSG
jgi:hypothetical protein